MMQQVSEDKGLRDFLLSFLRRALLFYIFLSLFRFIAYKETMLSSKLSVIGIAIAVATLSIVISWIQSLIKMDRKGKTYRYILLPIGTSIVTYLLLSFMRYVVLEEAILSTDFETILFAVFFGAFEAIGVKIDDISPRNPKKEPTKPVKYYIDTYIVNATPFHKVMFIVYGSCLILLFGIILYGILNR